MNLVLSATTKDVDLRGEVESYRSLEPDSLIITKVDESDDFGNIANLLLDASAPPLSWITNGQRVPEDIDVPHPSELADQILQFLGVRVGPEEEQPQRNDHKAAHSEDDLGVEAHWTCPSTHFRYSSLPDWTG